MVPDSDFDHHSPEHAANPAASYERIRKRPGVAHTSAHGGYWVLTRYDDIASAGKDHEALSSALQLGGVRGNPWGNHPSPQPCGHSHVARRDGST
jgi:cytochrome P450